MSITISLLTIEVMQTEFNIMQNGWDYPTHILTTFANELDTQTADWDWEEVIKSTKFDSWAQMLEKLATQLAQQIVHQTCPSAEFGITAFLHYHFPNKFLKRFHYTIPTTTNLYGGFDEGLVMARDMGHAIEHVNDVVINGFKAINEVLTQNNLPTFNYSLNEVEIEEERY